MKRNGILFWVGATLFLAAALLMTQVIGNQYPFFACYVILQFIVLAVAWSILGGYAGYVNFGTVFRCWRLHGRFSVQGV
jgi:branched-chain amino acid transport system permease protein